MQLGSSRIPFCALLLVAASLTTAIAQQPRPNRSVSAIPANVLLPVMRAEDERRWDERLAVLLSDRNAPVRKRAALAAGRIGDERALPGLIEALKTESDNDVRQMIAFAIGEIESPDGAAALIEILDDTRAPAEIRARAAEALGKIGGALLSSAPRDQKEPKPVDERLTRIRTAILDALKFEAGRRSMSDRETVLLGLTAVLRARPDGAGPVVVHFLKYSDARIVADALNTMARLRLKDGSEQVRQLLGGGDAVVRANAARVCGATEDKQAFDALLARALHDYDVRVRVSAIRALGSLKDAKPADRLLERCDRLVDGFRTSRVPNAIEKNEILEIIAVLGRILQNTNNLRAIDLFKRFRIADQLRSPETEIAFARVSPETYLRTVPLNSVPAQIDKVFPKMANSWRPSSSLVQGLAELANLPAEKKELRGFALAAFGIEVLSQESHDPRFVTAIPDYLRAYARFRNEVNESASPFPSPPANEDRLADTLRGYVTYKEKSPPEPFRIVPPDNRTPGYNDVAVRATAAELLGEQPASKENAEALVIALGQALHFDTQSNDAVLGILDALAKQKSTAANDAIKTALDSSDHLIRRRAVALLKANGAGDFSNRIGTVKTRNTDADYRRAIARIGKHVTATLVTAKGSFLIEFLPQDAPLTVDNFVQLARKGYFNGVTFHRVVPNFVIQGGDPRGDGSGGPGYSIRCEINEALFERAAVGMALSGKDTGGSQWFVTHAPQPHLDGGYTVFGRVIRGMDVVDKIARGDIIRRVIVSERN